MQCVLVRREGNLFAGMTVSLLRVTAPIGRESKRPPSDRPAPPAQLATAGGVAPRRPMRFFRLPAPPLAVLAALAAAALLLHPRPRPGSRLRRPTASRGDDLPGRPRQPLPARRGVAVSRDDAGLGLRQAFQRQPARDGWSPLAVPNAWNVGDNSVASMTGTVAEYRKDFRLPDARARMDWLVRFESVNYRLRIWLNGVAIGRNTGAYLPFDLRLPRRALKRTARTGSSSGSTTAA